MRDIADVTFGYKEPESFAREYGKSVVMLDGSNVLAKIFLDASDKINAILKEDVGRNYLPTLPLLLPGTKANKRV
ncbi:MAG: hypothetical protein IPI91_16520 [Flavobacteriales bacterium]|nr:hypothetical protein [Flavobacteriales bacterium]